MANGRNGKKNGTRESTSNLIIPSDVTKGIKVGKNNSQKSIHTPHPVTRLTTSGGKKSGPTGPTDSKLLKRKISWNGPNFALQKIQMARISNLNATPDVSLIQAPIGGGGAPPPTPATTPEVEIVTQAGDVLVTQTGDNLITN